MTIFDSSDEVSDERTNCFDKELHYLSSSNDIRCDRPILKSSSPISFDLWIIPDTCSKTYRKQIKIWKMYGYQNSKFFLTATVNHLNNCHTITWHNLLNKSYQTEFRSLTAWAGSNFSGCRWTDSRVWPFKQKLVKQSLHWSRLARSFPGFPRMRRLGVSLLSSPRWNSSPSRVPWLNPSLKSTSGWECPHLPIFSQLFGLFPFFQ